MVDLYSLLKVLKLQLLMYFENVGLFYFDHWYNDTPYKLHTTHIHNKCHTNVLKNTIKELNFHTYHQRRQSEFSLRSIL